MAIEAVLNSIFSKIGFCEHLFGFLSDSFIIRGCDYPCPAAFVIRDSKSSAFCVNAVVPVSFFWVIKDVNYAHFDLNPLLWPFGTLLMACQMYQMVRFGTF